MLSVVKDKLLSVAIQSIDFNQGQTDGTKTSLPVIPWSATWKPDNFSFATYTISTAREAAENNDLTVWAKFYKDTPQESVQVRAKNIEHPIPTTLREKLFDRYPGRNAIGGVEATRVFFGDTGQSVYRGKHSNVPLKISGAKFVELGVGVYDVIWQWEYRTISEESTKDELIWNPIWIPMERSMHRIFVTIDLPKSPWTPNPKTHHTSLDVPLWAEALFVACRWAQGAKTVDEAARKIANNLFNSGRFVYSIGSHYSKETTLTEFETVDGVPIPKFRLITEFYLYKALERINGGNGISGNANCVDCSLIVATLTNCLGGNLKIGKLQNTVQMNYSDTGVNDKNQFEVNRIRAIGKNTANTMKGLEDEGKSYFSYHSISWLPASADKPKFDDPNNLIYDACVQFVPDEEAEKGAGESASGLNLGDESNDGYRTGLAYPSPEGVPCCKPQQATVSQIRIVPGEK